MAKRIVVSIGDRFGDLTIEAELPIQHYPGAKGRSGAYRSFKCRCTCGGFTNTSLGHLTSGHTKRCANCRSANKSHGMSDRPEYRIWLSMIQRCHNPKSQKYQSYGARGITVCPEWRASFEAFYSDMGSRPSNSHSIERKDNSLGYSSSNCIWATRTEQQRNIRTNRLIEFKGEVRCAADWAQIAGKHPSELYRQKSNDKIQRILERWLPTY